MTCSVNVEFRRSGLRAGRGDLARFAREVLSIAMDDLGFAHGETTVLFCNDAEIRRLNRDFRQVDKPTDVLSFPASDDVAALKRERTPYLGDLAIALRYTKEHNLAGRRGRNALSDEVALLLVHGLLHLLGWDHATKRDEKRMWKEQARLLELCADLEQPMLSLSAR